jgi:hypothetical protein
MRVHAQFQQGPQTAHSKAQVGKSGRPLETHTLRRRQRVQTSILTRSRCHTKSHDDRLSCCLRRIQNLFRTARASFFLALDGVFGVLLTGRIEIPDLLFLLPCLYIVTAFRYIFRMTKCTVFFSCSSTSFVSLHVVSLCMSRSLSL